eukprot:3821098-Alexandrium_andersonii.AAC.1
MALRNASPAPTKIACDLVSTMLHEGKVTSWRHTIPITSGRASPVSSLPAMSWTTPHPSPDPLLTFQVAK